MIGHPLTTESYPEPPPSALRLLRRLDSPSLGRLSEPLLPAALANEAGHHTLTLLSGIARVLVERETATA